MTNVWFKEHDISKWTLEKGDLSPEVSFLPCVGDVLMWTGPTNLLYGEKDCPETTMVLVLQPPIEVILRQYDPTDVVQDLFRESKYIDFEAYSCVSGHKSRVCFFEYGLEYGPDFPFRWSLVSRLKGTQDPLRFLKKKWEEKEERNR